MRIRTTIGVAASARWIPMVVAGLTVMSTVTALTGSADPDRLGALTVPTTFAVALLQLREQVTLVARIQRLWRNVMMMSLVVLWAVVLVRLFGE